jgi:hypothetical protein
VNRLTGVWAIIGTQNGNYDSQATLQNWDPGEGAAERTASFPTLRYAYSPLSLSQHLLHFGHQVVAPTRDSPRLMI